MQKKYLHTKYLTVYIAKICRVSLVFLAACCALSVVSHASADQLYAVSGEAYNLKTGVLSYRELFTKIDTDQQVHVNYARPDGIVFARKVLDYSLEVFQPGVVFTDDRDDETVSAVFNVGQLIMTHRVKGDSETKTFYETSKLVIDAGIDAIIQQQWEKLLSGKKVNIDFANPRLLEIEKFVIKKIDAAESPLAYKEAKDTWKYFRIDAANKLPLLFNEPMYFAYESNGMFLMRYQGRSNIDNDKGEPWLVRIEYEYW